LPSESSTESRLGLTLEDRGREDRFLPENGASEVSIFAYFTKDVLSKLFSAEKMAWQIFFKTGFELGDHNRHAKEYLLYGTIGWKRWAGEYKLASEPQMVQQMKQPMPCLEERLSRKRKRSPEVDVPSKKQAVQTQMPSQNEVVIASIETGHPYLPRPTPEQLLTPDYGIFRRDSVLEVQVITSSPEIWLDARSAILEPGEFIEMGGEGETIPS
jgi:hypothetical protein